MPTATRPENCKYMKFDFVPEKRTSLTSLQHCGKHLAVGIIGETFVRKMGLESNLSLSNALRKFDRITDLRRFIPFANGEEFPHQPPKPSAAGSRRTPRTGNAASVESTPVAPTSSAQSSSTTAAPTSSAQSSSTTAATTSSAQSSATTAAPTSSAQSSATTAAPTSSAQSSATTAAPTSSAQSSATT
nr:hypothetical protein [Chlamydiota bacterium]